MVDNNHIVSGFDAELKALMTDLHQLGETVLSMTADAVKALKKENASLAHEVVERDLIANDLQDDVDNAVIRILALRQPMAADLRRVIGATRMAADLERIGDLAEGIARRVIEIDDEKSVKIMRSVARMGKSVRLQLMACLEAVGTDDLENVLEIWAADEEIDDVYASLFNELLTVMMADNRTIKTCTAMLFVAKNLERIGDHICNICESIYFTHSGKQLIKDKRLRANDRSG